MSAPAKLPRWAELALLPLINLVAALILSGVIVKILGESPWAACKLMVAGSLGSQEGIGYTLYYATNFMFTGLAVAVAYHAGLFNIGGEGQAYIGGLGSGLVALWLGQLPFLVVAPVAVLAGAAFGAAWAFIPAWLQARRGSHIVITTIMFNFIAAALMTYLLVNVLIKPGQQAPETREFGPGAFMPQASDVLAKLGITFASSPLNFAFVLALAGSLALNELLGSQHRILIDFPSGAGFVGIAVALMGRNHPLGIFLAAVLFGALAQGGSQLSFDMPKINRDMVVVIQGLVILFCGALENVFRGPLGAVFARFAKKAEAAG